MYTSPSFSSNTTRFIRTAAHCCITGSLIAAVGAAITAIRYPDVPSTSVSSPYTPPLFSVTQIPWAISYALIVVGIVGITHTDAVGFSRVGKIGLWVAIIGKSMLAVGNVGYAFFATATRTDAPILFLDSLMGAASLVTAFGFVLAGIVVLRVGRWQGWQGMRSASGSS